MKYAKSVSFVETVFLPFEENIIAELAGAFLIPSAPLSYLVIDLGFRALSGSAKLAWIL